MLGATDVIMVSLLSTFNTLACSVSLADIEQLYCLNLTLSMCFRVSSGRPFTFKTKLHVTKIDNSLHLLPIFTTKISILDVA